MLAVLVQSANPSEKSSTDGITSSYRLREIEEGEPVRGLLAAIVLSAVLSSSTSGVALAAAPLDVAPAGCPSTPITGPAHATVPPKLQLLEQKTEHLKLSSIRLSAHLVLTSPTGMIKFDDITVAKLPPRESMTTVTLEGHGRSGKAESETHRILEIGDVTYKYEPALTHGDGGRPWVREARERSPSNSRSMSLSPSIGRLGEAQSIVETGTANIDGQPVSQFTAIFAPGAYPQSELPFGELFEDACSEPVQIDLALTSSGLPVRVSVSDDYLRSNEAITATATTQILATDFPFPTLRPPSRKRTISADALRRFDSARLSKELRKEAKRTAHKGPKKHR